MINAIIKGVFKIMTSVISLLLSPINNLINQYLPGFSSALTGLAQIFNLIGDFVGFILNALCITPTTISFIVSVWVFKLTFPLLVSAVKLIVKWYNALKL